MSPATKRGRPPKFGRPGRLLAFTVPDDVREWLESVHPDPGWALVALFEAATAPRRASGEVRPAPVAEIALLAGRRGLIVVDRKAVPAIPGVALIPLSDTQAFLALEPGRGLADVELAVIDALEEGQLVEGRAALSKLRDLLRKWRNDPLWHFEPRTVVVAESRDHQERGRGKGSAKKPVAR
jgi:hypothetical protein